MSTPAGDDYQLRAGAWIAFALSAGIDLDGAAEQYRLSQEQAKAAVGKHVEWLRERVGEPAGSRTRSRRKLPPGWRVISGKGH